jgi:hypothetical protein
MIDEPVETQQSTLHTTTTPIEADNKRALRPATLLLPLLSALGYILCILLTVAPLSRIPDSVIHLQTPFGPLLASIGAWLPTNLGLAADTTASQASSQYVLFLGLLALAFVFYGLIAWFIARQPSDAAIHRRVRAIIWISALVAGIIYVFTPAMLSHDILVYTSYSRLLANYHANPYFVPLSHFPRDPYVPLNYWAGSVAAYGPLWLLVCGLLGLVAGPSPVSYILAFRLFALASHLVSTWLVGQTLRATGQSQRTVTLGTLLYALNPLVLLESSLGGHNDVFMVTLLLAGLWLAARAQQRGRLLLPDGYLPPLIAFTLATLVKFTALPVIGLFIAFVAWNAWHGNQRTESPSRQANARRWWSAIDVIVLSAVTACLVALAFYGPFWIHHNLRDILKSFSNPPSALFAENSILRAILAWSHNHSLPAGLPGKLLSLFSIRKVWDDLNIAVVGLTCIAGVIWLWRSPTLRAFTLASLVALGALLLITPWFYSWYVTWLVGLAAVALPLCGSRAGRALLAFTLAFSASALLTYLYKDGYAPFGIWTGFICLITIAPPLLALLLALLTWRPASQAIS